MMKKIFCVSFLVGFLFCVVSGVSVAADKPVKMIGSGVLSGKLGALPESGWGFIDAAYQVNERGFVPGRKFEVILEDGQYDIPLCVSIFNRVTAAEPRDELMFHSGWQTGALHAIAEKVKENHVVCVDGSMSPVIFTDEVQTKYPYFFSCGVSYAEQTGALIKFIRSKLHKGPDKPRLAFVYIESGVGREPIPAAKEYCKKFGVDLVLIEPVTFTQTDYTPTLMKIRRAKADYAILWAWSIPVGTRFFKMARKVLPKVQLLTQNYLAQEILSHLIGESADGIYAFSPYPRPSEPKNPIVAKALQMVKKEKRKLRMWDLYFQSYLMALMNAEGAIQAAKAGNLTREGCRDALENLTDWDPFGMYEGLKFDYSNHTFPRGRILKHVAANKSLVPVTEWVSIKEYLK
ncbi:MAG: ABC transporter substrate-binding protein [Thermodesulfobacteriota bacterium]|nr:ABC transporter substrate-binding protein [Thermodesulfobacteriota bacterium]